MLTALEEGYARIALVGYPGSGRQFVLQRVWDRWESPNRRVLTFVGPSCEASLTRLLKTDLDLNEDDAPAGSILDIRSLLRLARLLEHEYAIVTQALARKQDLVEREWLESLAPIVPKPVLRLVRVATPPQEARLSSRGWKTVRVRPMTRREAVDYTYPDPTRLPSEVEQRRITRWHARARGLSARLMAIDANHRSVGVV
jgi:hypothetical protein